MPSLFRGKVTMPTPFMQFWQRSLYSARMAFLWGWAIGISDFEKSTGHFFISAPIGPKFCTRLEGGNKQNRVGANFEFPSLTNLAPLYFCVCITANGTKHFKSALFEFSELFWVDIFTRISPKA